MRKIFASSLLVIFFLSLFGIKQAHATDCKTQFPVALKLDKTSGDTTTKFKISGTISNFDGSNLRIGANLVGAADGAPDSQENNQSVPVDPSGNFSTDLILPTAGNWDMFVQPQNCAGDFLPISPPVTISVSQGAAPQSGSEVVPNSTACPSSAPAVSINGKWVCGGGDSCDPSDPKACGGGTTQSCVMNAQGETRCATPPDKGDLCIPSSPLACRTPFSCVLSVVPDKTKGAMVAETSSPMPTTGPDGSPTTYTKDIYKCTDLSENQSPPCAYNTIVIGHTSQDTGVRPITSTSQNCEGVYTAFGFAIDTNPISLVKELFGIILSLMGGIAVIMILVQGLRIMTSAGNPETIKEARETLQSALIGLIFALLSLVILQTIGFDILHIPGITP